MPVARLLYTLLLALALPWMPLWLTWRGRRHRGYRDGWAERFLGRSAAPRTTAPTVWIHTVSVGETRAAQPVVEALLANRPDLHILLTHHTPTGRGISERLFGDRVERCYLPYDLPWAVAAFLRQHRPVLGVLVETEVWPNLVAGCQRTGVPLCLINGRLSARSARSYDRLGWLARPAFAGLSRVLAQTAAEADRFRALGSKDVHVVDNLKFDAAPDPTDRARGRAWRDGWGPRPVWLAASTREGEDEAILEALTRIPEPALLLWVPRHPHRTEQIMQMLDRAGIRSARRSAVSRLAPAVRVWLGDSLGELSAYIEAADVVFVGGSLAPLGGQNLLEACALGKPVLVGPHTFNFLEVTDAAVAAGAALRVDDGMALGDAVAALLEDADRRARMGAAATAFWSGRRGATQATLELISGYLPPPAASGGSGSPKMST